MSTCEGCRVSICKHLFLVFAEGGYSLIVSGESPLHTRPSSVVSNIVVCRWFSLPLLAHFRFLALPHALSSLPGDQCGLVLKKRVSTLEASNRVKVNSNQILKFTIPILAHHGEGSTFRDFTARAFFYCLRRHRSPDNWTKRCATGSFSSEKH